MDQHHRESVTFRGVIEVISMTKQSPEVYFKYFMI